MDKPALRKIYLQKRKSLSDEEVQRRSLQLLTLLQQRSELLLQGPVHIFLPIRKFNEVDTWPIIHWLWTRGIATQTTLTDTENTRLRHVWFDEKTAFIENLWGIPEPASAQPADPSVCSTVLVPLLVADKRGHRIGYGKGFYDGFLVTLPSGVRKIGLSMFPLIDKIDTFEAHDILLDEVLVAGP